MSNTVALKNKETPCFYIKFYPGIKSSLGCEKATLILGRLEYWFEKYTTGFYKFIEPCSHPLYREGDSWSEEIGFSRKIFVKAFDVIGVRYKSKSAFLKAKDKFQGKLYASYHDRKTNQTYFVRNHAFASQFIKGLFNKLRHSSLSKQKTERDKKTPPINSNTTSNMSFYVKGCSRNGQNCRSSGGTIGGKENKSIQKNSSSLECPASQKTSNVNSTKTEETEEMIKIWKEEIGDLSVSSISTNLSSRLAEALKHFFGQSLDQWKYYCRMISSSKFLMGEAQNKFFKKAWITWAIKEETVSRIRGGEFRLGDRQTNHDKHIQEISENLKILENKRNEIKQEIESIKYSVKIKRKNKVKEKMKTFSGKEIESLKQDFEEFLREESNSITEEFKKKRWKGMFVQPYFEGFVEEKVTTLLFINSAEQEAGKIIKDSGLLNILKEVEDNTLQLKRKMHAFFERGKSPETHREPQSPLSFQKTLEAGYL